MNRFWIFPLVLAILGSFLPFLVITESLLPVGIASDRGVFPSFDSLMRDLSEVWSVTAPYGAVVGLFLGLGLASFDGFRNGFRTAPANRLFARLLLNLWWCGLYAATITALNTLLFCLLIRVTSIVARFPSILFPLLLAAIFGLCAVIWASIRTITTTDVISPRVLSNKLKRSAHIQDQS